MGAPSKIDRLIEQGLSRYGAGDLQGALTMWEEALAIDPGNKQASSYVDYVRLHFELLGSEPEVAPGEDAPFGIQEEPEYQIEVDAGELPPRESQPVLSSDDLDGGWFDAEIAAEAAAHRMATVPSQSYEDEAEEIEIEAEPAELELELEADLPPFPEVSFEGATREYYGTPTPPVMAATPADFAETGTDSGTREFRPQGTDAGTSEYRPERGVTDGGGTSEFRPQRANESGGLEFAHEEYTGGFSSEGTPLGFAMQSTEVRKRDLGFVQPIAATESATDKNPPVAVGDAVTRDNLSLEKTTERPSFAKMITPTAEEPDEEDLLATLPNPRRQQLADVAQTQDIPLAPSTKAVTKELPDSGRPPAKRDSRELSQAEVMLTHAPTQDFQAPRIDITAPTRDLGLRPRPPTKSDPIDDDVPTKQSDVRAIRDAAARNQGGAPKVEPDPEGTSSDIALRFDPIDARAAEILEEVDADAPADEPRDDQTRRRIAALLERAVQWNAIGETEKAVSAVDLAMSEDPNSALGQKLITRNRDTIMGVFQGYLGDLERMPHLARPLHELQDAPISPRAAFLLSRIDGTLTIDELLDVSGMPRLEAYRHLCQLYLRGILR